MFLQRFTPSPHTIYLLACCLEIPEPKLILNSFALYSCVYWLLKCILAGNPEVKFRDVYICR